ncbi:MAG: DUF1559 domain-containing protein [Fimbriiglobus sp.]
MSHAIVRKTSIGLVLLLLIGVSFVEAQPQPQPEGKPISVAKDAPKASSEQSARSRKNLHAIALATQMHNDAIGLYVTDHYDENDKPLLSWRVMLLTLLDQTELFKQFNLKEPWDGPTNKPLLAKMPAVYKVGIEPEGSTKTYYQFFKGKGCFVDPTHTKKQRRRTIQGVIDGYSNTVGVVECGPPVEWTKPDDLSVDLKTLDFSKLEQPFSEFMHCIHIGGEPYKYRTGIVPKTLGLLIDPADGQLVPAQDLIPWPVPKSDLPKKP